MWSIVEQEGLKVIAGFKYKRSMEGKWNQKN
jgi:hypothetical protein